MRYWWANQAHAYGVETAGGYLWSRQRRADGTRNPFYDSVRLTQPGDVVFAYCRGEIRAVGMVLSPARASPAPRPLPRQPADEAAAGWLIDVAWIELKRPLRPSSFMSILAPVLPDVHAPLTPRGRGIQGGRLLELPVRLARVLLQLAGGTDPRHVLNPDWVPEQLSFGFGEGNGPRPPGAGETGAAGAGP
jgi:hypothetical protein